MLYLVRHGQTDWNLNGRYGGRIDVPLNAVGIEQAKQISKDLSDVRFDFVYSSPLKRAYDTAKIITNNEIIIDDRLIERSNGELEGMLKSDIKDVIDFNDPNEKRYNIENIIDFRKRIKSFLDDIIEMSKDKNILIVTHAGVGIYIRCYFEGEPKDNNYLNYKIKNCEIIKYDNY